MNYLPNRIQINKFKDFIRYFLNGFFPIVQSRIPRPHLNIRPNLFFPSEKNALVSYINDKEFPFALNLNKHNAFRLCSAIIESLIELGYSVDLIDYRDIFFKSKKKYDLAIIHGAKNKDNIVKLINNRTYVIYFSTGSYWRFNNESERKRIENSPIFSSDIRRERYINENEDESLKISDLILTLGNRQTCKTYHEAGFTNIVTINGITDIYKADNSQFTIKSNMSSNYLFFAGDGNIHKGLDLLIEVFSKNENLHLWIIANIDSDFRSTYNHLLNKSRNIHIIGWIELYSTKFCKIANKCSFVILPSCSEGQAISVIECMSIGLIPIVSEFSGINVHDFGFVIRSLDIESVSEIIYKTSKLEERELLKRSEMCSFVVKNSYSKEHFKKSFKSILDLRVSNNMN